MAPRLRLLLTLLTLGAGVARAQAPSRSLTLASIFSPDPEVRVDFDGSPVTGLAWAPDARSYLHSPEVESEFRSPERETVHDGDSQPLVDRARLIAALAELEDFPRQDAERLLQSAVQVGPHLAGLLIERAGDLFYYSIADGTARRLSRGSAAAEVAGFSPDGRKIAFVRAHDLHLVEVDTGKQTALTSNGSPELLNGKLDWVYQEEIYGRGNFTGYWWSPDSRRIAYLQLDQTRVAPFTLVDHLPTRPATEVIRYPKAGEPNPEARLGVLTPASDESVWLDTSRYLPEPHLIVRVGWTPDGEKVFFLVQDRGQTWLDINLADPATGETRTLMRETSPAFVEVELTGSPHFLQDGSFLWISARNGYHHLYHFAASGEVQAQLTAGEWEVRCLYGIDEVTGWVYFSASEHSPLEDHIYRLRLDGTDLQRLSSSPGQHEARFSPDFTHYLDSWSSYDRPRRVALHRADGSRVRLVDVNTVPALAEFGLATAEFLQVPTADGFVLEAAWIRPPDFDPARKYPVLQFNYGGPHAPVVRNRWGGSRHLWLRYLAQEGYVVWLCDNRSASGKGIWPTWQAYGRLGDIELQDIEACLDWLKSHPWVDADRIGIYGGSYGGFLSAYALTHSQDFKVGIAFAPVTDWRLYDSVYTERYMKRPQDNPSGYRSASVIEAAARLHGRLLLVHGTMDDNVHLQNTLKLAEALQRAGKSFDLMLYPTARHGVRDQAQVYHLYTLMTEFLQENL